MRWRPACTRRASARPGSAGRWASGGSVASRVRAPTTVNAELARSRVDAVLIPVDLEPSSVPSFIDTLRGWQNSPGCIVTVPHKTEVAGLIDALTDRAKLLGAVNMVRRTPPGK